jgi:hypothetical protein
MIPRRHRIIRIIRVRLIPRRLRLRLIRVRLRRRRRRLRLRLRLIRVRLRRRRRRLRLRLRLIRVRLRRRRRRLRLRLRLIRVRLRHRRLRLISVNRFTIKTLDRTRSRNRRAIRQNYRIGKIGRIRESISINNIISFNKGRNRGNKRHTSITCT